MKKIVVTCLSLLAIFSHAYAQDTLVFGGIINVNGPDFHTMLFGIDDDLGRLVKAVGILLSRAVEF